MSSVDLAAQGFGWETHTNKQATTTMICVMCATIDKSTRIMGEHSKAYLSGIVQLHLS